MQGVGTRRRCLRVPSGFMLRCAGAQVREIEREESAELCRTGDRQRETRDRLTQIFSILTLYIIVHAYISQNSPYKGTNREENHVGRIVLFISIHKLLFHVSHKIHKYPFHIFDYYVLCA